MNENTIPYQAKGVQSEGFLVYNDQVRTPCPGVIVAMHGADRMTLPGTKLVN